MAATNQAIVFAIDAGTFLLSAFLIVSLHVRKKMPHSPHESLSYQKVFNGIIQSLKIIFQQQELKITICVSAACILFVSGIIRFILPIYVKDIFLSQGQLIGLVMSLIACGTVGGVLLYNWLITSASLTRLLMAWSIYGILLFAIVWFPNKVWVLGCSFAVGIAGAWVDITLTSNIQHFSPRDYLGRSFSFFSTLANTAEALSGLLAGLLVSITSVSFCLGVFSLIVCLVPVIVFLRKSKL